MKQTHQGSFFGRASESRQAPIHTSLWTGDTAGSAVKIQTFLENASKHSLNPYNAVAINYRGELSVQRRR